MYPKKYVNRQMGRYFCRLCSRSRFLENNFFKIIFLLLFAFIWIQYTISLWLIKKYRNNFFFKFNVINPSYTLWKLIYYALTVNYTYNLLFLFFVVHLYYTSFILILMQLKWEMKKGMMKNKALKSNHLDCHPMVPSINILESAYISF